MIFLVLFIYSIGCFCMYCTCVFFPRTFQILTNQVLASSFYFYLYIFGVFFYFLYIDPWYFIINKILSLLFFGFIIITNKHTSILCFIYILIPKMQQTLALHSIQYCTVFYYKIITFVFKISTHIFFLYLDNILIKQFIF